MPAVLYEIDGSARTFSQLFGGVGGAIYDDYGASLGPPPIGDFTVTVILASGSTTTVLASIGATITITAADGHTTTTESG